MSFRALSRAARCGALLLACAFVTACGGPRCPALRITDPGQALASRHYDAAAITSLRAEAKVDQRGKGGRVKGRVLMFVQRPDRVRFDVMTQFGPVLVLSSDGFAFALSDFKEQRFMTGPACERNIARLVGVAISGEAVTSVLLGDVPAIDASTDTLSCSPEGGYRVERRSKQGALQTIELAVHQADMNKPAAQQRSELREVVYSNAQGKRLYRVRYEDYHTVGKGGVRLPFTVRIEDFGSDSDAVLRFSSIDVNVRVPDEAFAQTPRAGLRVEAVSCE